MDSTNRVSIFLFWSSTQFHNGSFILLLTLFRSPSSLNHKQLQGINTKILVHSSTYPCRQQVSLFLHIRTHTRSHSLSLLCMHTRWTTRKNICWHLDAVAFNLKKNPPGTVQYLRCSRIPLRHILRRKFFSAIKSAKRKQI